MGKDTSSRKYLQNKTVFADAFNMFLFKGKQVIKAENLKEADTVEIAVPHTKKSKGTEEKRYRDLLMSVMTDEKMVYVLLGIENQSEVHYAMPVRNMLYDAIELTKQVNDIGDKNRQEKKAKNTAEYLSGFLSEDRLIPVVTIVVLWNKDKWDGPVTLKEMYIDEAQAIAEYLPDYKLNLISPGDISEEEFNKFKTSLGSVLKFVKYSGDKEKLKNLVQEDKSFKRLERNAVDLLNDVTGAEIPYDEEEEEVDVCVAIKEMVEDGYNDGRVAGYNDGVAEGERSLLISLAQKGLLSIEVAANEKGVSVEDFKSLMKNTEKK